MQKTRMSADQLYAMPDDEFRYELVRGELVKMPPAGSQHADIEMVIASSLFQHVRPAGLGRAWSGDAGFRLREDHVLAPDVSFVSESRIPASGLPVGFFPGAPDMAVEVISPSERESHISQKVADYLANGCKMVVLVRPLMKTVEVHQPGREAVSLGGRDVLEGGDAVHGWRLPVDEIFA